MLSGSLIVMPWRVLRLWTEESWLPDVEGRADTTNKPTGDGSQGCYLYVGLIIHLHKNISLCYDLN
jgi:hypothetical protein